jgi:hypothetical protein
VGLRYAVGVGVAVSVAVGACGDGSSPDVDAGQAAGRELPSAAADRLLWEPPRAHPVMAASDGQLLVVGGIDQLPDEPDLLRVASDAVLVDLATGEESLLAAPEADVPVHVLGAAADPEGFVVTGQRCAGGDRLPADEWSCRPGTATAFRLSADDRSWEEIPFPESVSPLRGDTPWTFQPTMGTVPDGSVFVVALTGPASPGSDPTPVLVLDRERWVEVASLADVRPVGACATADAIYVLTSVTSTSEEGTPPPAEMELYEAPIGGGDAVAVDIPDVDTSFGGIAVAAACDRSGVYLTSSTPDPSEPMQLYARRGTEWRLVGGDWEAGIVTRLASAPNGIAVVSQSIAGEDALVALTVHAGEDTAERIAGENVERALVTDRSSGNFVTVGPLPRLSLELAPDPDRPPGPVTADHLAP